MMDLYENILWGFGILGMICLPLLMFVGQTSYIQDKDIQIQEETNVVKKQAIFIKALEKYIKDPNKLRIMKQNIQNFSKMSRNNSPTKPSSPSKSPSNGSTSFIREANSSETAMLPPNYRVKVISSDFKMKYANSFMAVMNVAKQATSRFVQTPEGVRPQITSIRPSTIIQRMGFRPGDVILRVNGRPISSIKEGKDLYYSLKNEPSYLIEVLRGGQRFQFVYKIGN